MSFPPPPPSELPNPYRENNKKTVAVRRGSSSGRGATKAKGGKKLLAADELTLRTLIGQIEAEVNKSGKDLLSPLSRLCRLIQRQEAPKQAAFVKNTKGAEVLLRVINKHENDGIVILAVQALAVLCSNAKAAGRLAKRGVGPRVVKALAVHKSSKELQIKIGIYSCIAALANQDPDMATAFQGLDCMGYTVDFVKANMGIVKTILPAVRAMVGLTNEYSASAFVDNKAVALTTKLAQRFSGHLKYHVILKYSLKLLSKLVQHECNLPPVTYRNGVRRLLGLLLDWIKLDVRHKHDHIRREIIVVLTKMVSNDVGRKAFNESGGIGVVMEVIVGAEAGNGLPHKTDKFMASCIILLRKCRPNQPLPPLCGLSFDLPEVAGGPEPLDDGAAESDEEEDVGLHSGGPGSRFGLPGQSLSAEEAEDGEDDFGDIEVDVDADDDADFLPYRFCVSSSKEDSNDSNDSNDSDDVDGDGELDGNERTNPAILDDDLLAAAPALNLDLRLTKMPSNNIIDALAGSRIDVDASPPTVITAPNSDDDDDDDDNDGSGRDSAGEAASGGRGGGSDQGFESEPEDTFANLDQSCDSIDGQDEIEDHVGPYVSPSKLQQAEDIEDQTGHYQSDDQHEDQEAITAVDEDEDDLGGGGSGFLGALGGPSTASLLDDSDDEGDLDDHRAATVVRRPREEVADASGSVPVSLNAHADLEPEQDSTEVWEVGREAEVHSMRDFFPEIHRHLLDGVAAEPALDDDLHTVRNVNSARVPAASFPPTSMQPEREPLLRSGSKKGLRRKLLFDDMQMLSDIGNVRDRVVYDVEDPDLAIDPTPGAGPALVFDSRFESGNLRRAVQVHETLYDLVLSPDINSEGHTQWFFFSVTGMVPDVRYRFNIVNLEKSNSQFNFGMQPVMLSEAEAAQGGTWRRAGTRICYHKNNLKRETGKASKTRYFSETFSMTFRHKGDKCFIAFHYPYTYTDSQRHIRGMVEARPDIVRRQLLCRTLGGNRCDLLTITSTDPEDERTHPVARRKYVVLSGRVHPGESNASWMVKGLLDFVVGDTLDARRLRRTYVFKVVPMLNPDGVANGNHRCSLAGCDLNRKWRTPHPVLHPTIYRTRLLLSYLKLQGITPELYCDFHGHSRRKMIFMYGCSETAKVKQFPRALGEAATEFSMKNCRFSVTPDKEGSARVVVWRHYGVLRSYTIESTFCGFDRGAFHGDQICCQDMSNLGASFARQLLTLAADEEPRMAPVVNL